MQTIKDQSWRILIFTILMAALLSVLISNLLRSFYFCINPNDFGIYQQAIYEIARGHSWNPFLTIRNLFIFSDHSDPIIFVAAIFVKIFGYSPTTLIFFEWLCLSIPLVLLFYFKRFSSLLHPEFLLGAFFILFNRALLDGFEFPIHPSTWSFLSIFILFYYLSKERSRYIILWAFIICLHRETFPFAIFGLAFHSLLYKKWRLGLALASISTFFILLYFILRPKLLGNIVPYGGGVETAMMFFKSPISYSLQSFSAMKLPWTALFSYMPTIILMWYWKIQRPLIFAALCFSLPLFGLHFVAHYLAHHHALPIIAPFVATLICSNMSERLLQRSNHILLIILISIMFFTSSSRYTRMIKVIIGKDNSCHAIASKQKSYHQISEIINHIDNKARLLSSGGAIQRLMRPNQKIYQIANTTDASLTFDYLLLEKNSPGDIFPLNENDLKEIRQRCHSFASTILWDDDYFYLAQGSFTDRCLELKKKWPWTRETGLFHEPANL